VKKKLISGTLATMFLATMITVAFPARVSAAPSTVKIGVVGPKGWIQWDGLWEASQIARDMINKKPGTEFGPGGDYYWPGPAGMLVYDGTPGGAVAQVELVDIDEHSVPAPDPAAAIAELITKVEANPTMSTIIGGYLEECVIPMQEALMDYAITHKRPIWIICGANTKEIIPPGKYERYKYMFRVTPLNVTALAMSFGALIGQIVAPKLAALYYGNPATLVPTYVIFENLVWCDEMLEYVQDNSAALGIDIKGFRRPSPIATDFAADLAAAEGAGAKLVVHAFSAVAGANFIKQVGALKPKFACVGINVESQMQEFYASVSGACEYETFLATVATQEGLTDAESVNPTAKPWTSNRFWDYYKTRWGHCPIYTAWGAYDTIIGLNETSYDPVGSGQASAGNGWTRWLNPADINNLITHTETLGVSDGFAWKRDLIGGSYYRNNMVGKFKFTGVDGKGHDVFCSAYSLSPDHDGVVRASIPQWQAGRLESTYPRTPPYARKWMFPSWMYSLETDFAGGDMVPTGVAGFDYTMPDTAVGTPDMDTLIGVWFKDLTGYTGFHRLECDMQPYDHFVDVYDAARVGIDWGRSEVPG